MLWLLVLCCFRSASSPHWHTGIPFYLPRACGNVQGYIRGSVRSDDGVCCHAAHTAVRGRRSRSSRRSRRSRRRGGRSKWAWLLSGPNKHYRLHDEAATWHARSHARTVGCAIRRKRDIGRLDASWLAGDCQQKRENRRIQTDCAQVSCNAKSAGGVD